MFSLSTVRIFWAQTQAVLVKAHTPTVLAFRLGPGHPDLNATFETFQGVDSTNTAYGGVTMGEVYPATGQLFEQYFFLREGETGLHTFLRMAYHNTTTPFLRNLQELRFLFRPNTPLWTHLTTNADFYAPLPVPDPASGATGIAAIVQDTTWDLSNRTGDPYVEQMTDYFTKYTFQDTNRDHDVHGLFADGSTSPSNLTYGAWMVMNTKDTYFGGPLSSDLTVDGIVYNYIVSNHHGDGTPNITDGFDRTFGPQFYYFNKGAAGTSLATLRSDALQYYSPSFAVDFYDSIANYVPNYVPTSGRGSWSAKIHLPDGATNPIAVLAASGVDFQDNTFNATAYQYWAAIDSSGRVEIDRIKEGTYRLTVYADGIFGQYAKDGIVIKPGKPTDSSTLHWEAESAGTELWRIGSPDKSSGEFRHGYARDTTHPLHPPEYRIYWGAYDFASDFPGGVNFTVGKSDVAKDFNYVHWSVFGGFSDSRRPAPYYGDGNVNNWTVLFDPTSRQLKKKTQATFTIQLAGAKTAAGNTDAFNSTQPWNNLPLTVVVNGHQLESWVIP
jgi:rhamnogalacturonan endolyase